MKLLLLFLTILVGGAIYVMGNFGVVQAPLLSHIQQQEGSPDAIQAAAQKDDFVARYGPLLHERYYLGQVANIMDNAAMFTLAQDTYLRYDQTPLKNDPDYGFFLLTYGVLLEGGFKFQDSADRFQEYLTLFPNGPGVAQARSAIFGLRVNHGVQLDTDTDTDNP